MPVGDKMLFTPWGLFTFGERLARLEWAVATVAEVGHLANFLEELRPLSTLQSFEDIGKVAAWWHDYLSNRPYQQIVDGDTKDKLRLAITQWKSLASERIKDLWLCTPQTTLQPEKLFLGVAGFLREEDVAVLEQLEIHDLNQACKCIITGCSTASEFIGLRAAESLLRRWYEKKTGKKIQKRTWGAVIDQLEKEYPNEKERPKEIILLNYLGLRRNEVDHPERISSQRDAETTLMNVFNLIGGIRTQWSVLPEASSTGTPPPLPWLRTQ